MIDDAKESICAEADRLVNGDRQRDYGTPLENFERIADFWTVLLEDKLEAGAMVEPQDVARCMILLKVARDMQTPKRDNAVDGAGYFKCLDMVREEEARRAAIISDIGAQSETTTLRRPTPERPDVDEQPAYESCHCSSCERFRDREIPEVDLRWKGDV